MLIFLFSIGTLGVCSSNKDKPKIERLEKQVSELQTQIENFQNNEQKNKNNIKSLYEEKTNNLNENHQAEIKKIIDKYNELLEIKLIYENFAKEIVITNEIKSENQTENDFIKKIIFAKNQLEHKLQFRQKKEDKNNIKNKSQETNAQKIYQEKK